MSRTAAILAAALLVATPASAQVMGASELNVDVPVKGAPSPKPVADIYYLAGESGAKETYTLTVKGPATLTLFGPDGSEILTVGGAGTVKLEVVLPFTDVFTLAVARALPAQTYTLARNATVPTPVEAQLASNVGYASKIDNSFTQCWLVPGVKSKISNSTGSQVNTLAADRRSVTQVYQGSKGTSVSERTVTFDGSNFHVIVKLQDGRTDDHLVNMDFPFDPQKNGHFTGYLCKD